MRHQANHLILRTPEGIVFTLPLAGPVTRGLALAIDLACVSVLTSAVGRFLPLLDWINPGLAQALRILLFFVVSIGYGIVCEWFWNGRTLGKWLLRLRVYDEEGLPLAFSQIALRNLMRCIDALPVFYLVGGACCLLSRHSQRAGDFVARTVVLRLSESRPIGDDALPLNKYNSLQAHPHLAARLRQKTTAEEAVLAFQALLRRDDFSPETRIRLFAEFRRHFEEKVPFPDSAVIDLTDEQSPRNIVQTLFQKARPATAPAVALSSNR